MKTTFKVVLGVLIGGLLLIGGCVALIAGGANEAAKEIDKEQAKNAITNNQARGIERGTTRGEVESKFGKPADGGGAGSDTCIFYNAKDAGVLRQWQFCFRGKSREGKLFLKDL